MTTVKVSPKFQIVIPKEIRERMKIRPGQELHVLELAGRIELLPVEPISEYRGFLKGMPTNIERDEEDRV